MAAIPSFNIAPGESSDATAARRKIAMALMMQGTDTSPVRHWTQGAARALQGALGGYELYREDQKDEKEKTDARDFNSGIIKALYPQSGGVVPAAPATPAPRGVPMAGGATEPLYSGGGANGWQVDNVNGQRVAVNQTPEGDGISRVPSPLDPPSDKERPLLAALVQAEGTPYAANVVRNRAAETGLTIPQVIAQRGQFEPVGSGAINKYGPGTQGYNNANAAIDSAYAGNDPTRGAVNFYAPAAQAALASKDGRPPVAKFDNGQGVDLGTTRFFSRAEPPVQSDAITAQSRAPQAGQPMPSPTVQQPNLAAILPGMLNNKYTSPLAQAIISQQLQNQLGSKDPTWGVVGEDEFGKKTYGWINPRTQTAIPAQPQGGSAQPGAPLTVSGPDGKPIPIPPGVDPKKFRDTVTTGVAEAAIGKKTEVQANSESFANRMESAEKNLNGLEKQGQSLSGKALQDAPYGLGTVGNYLKSEDRQKYEQGRSQFITALLRRESGAAINKDEFTRYDKEFFPQPGDTDAVLAQKRDARRVAIEAMKKGAGPGYKAPTESQAQAAPKGSPQAGHVEQGYRFKGGNPADPNSWEKI